ncbi:TobH protein [Mycobacterium sp. CBMA293]|uniref:TobH protein n=1 Tax=unclassified Mycolicibacterium TaxID=2636767 RepID=UPI0012DF56A6|nr:MULTISPECIES: TobH protein [unclassified Mycolicibacterium]MUL46829.1 TobH protein [Mycolicibacterium sp. CBMA 360]MUL57386.1 TobH protein [Mycolicibacterium sp. CBMA 335]MUL70426.1 TobH protein [Mycolicibacterium sp. CBMA 311]MUL92474.1 TobH protein [Mycolicibacterium sp. CBMA 230]MUM04395.1 TobH protein [Mycolicibacterium sp. CBMA 213]
MSAAPATLDLDDVDGLIAADRDGLLRAASMAGAQTRAVAAALSEGELDDLRSDQRPRAVTWVCGSGASGAPGAAGTVLAATLGSTLSIPLVVSPEVPPWIGALDVVVVAGDDPADPALVAAVATGVRRGARVIVVAPNEGPLRDAAAGRAVVLPPRLTVPDDFGLTRYLAAGLATLMVVDPALRIDLDALADELDAEALRNSAAREIFTNPAKNLAERMSGRQVVLAGEGAAMLALVRHAATVLLRVAHQLVAAAGGADALVALHGGLGRQTGAEMTYETSLFHDPEIDGPVPARVRTVVLCADEERPGVIARMDALGGLGDVDVLSADDVPDAGLQVPGSRLEQQIAMLAVRLEMTAVYLKLVRG